MNANARQVAIKKGFFMLPNFCICFLLLFSTSLSDATPPPTQSCQIETSVPARMKKIGSSSVTGHYDGNVEAKGGQKVYVKIKNENVLGASYVLNIADNSTPPSAPCSYKAILPPKTTVILSDSLFAKTPIGWRAGLSIGSETDSATLTYEVFSDPTP